MLGNHLLGATVQIAGARVVAQAAPQTKHLVLLCRSQGGDVGKAR